MRAPDDLPRRPRRASRRNRGRTILIAGVVLAFILLTSLRGIAGFYTDFLWYDSLGEGRVWRGVLGAKVVLALIFILLFFLLCWVNLLIADRIAPPFRMSGPEDELLERYHDLVSERAGWVRGIVAGLLALIAGSGVSSEWNSWILFTHGGSFGVKDPQFHRDVGFYVFKLPFLSFVVDWLFASLLIILIVVTVAHYLNGGIRVQPPSPRVTPQVKAHLSVLLAALAVVKAADYWLQRFELTTSTRGFVEGASYTDVKAQLPALNLLVLISVAAAILFVANIFRRGWTLPVLAVGLWMFVAVVVGGIYPQYVQRFKVQPNESAKESPYIERNIKATRSALNLGGVTTQKFTPTTDPGDVKLAPSEPTIRNIRLWDPAPTLAGSTFQQLQRIRDYYNINDIDVDRYPVDGQPTQVNIGARTINTAGIPGKSWENQHLAYTHGYGVVLAPSSASVGNEPDFMIGDIPPSIDPRIGGAKGLRLDKAGIYFGEDLSGYIVVNTNRKEIDYQSSGDGTKTTTYTGKDGIKANSLVRRAAFALRFGDLNPLISDFMNDHSKIIFERDVADRVRALAPFLHTDADPYPVVIGGRVQWVVDMYTTTSRYPYAQKADTSQLPSGSGLNHQFNYVRNSVKATVDAYDGTVKLYDVDSKHDPIIRAYEKAFPGLFTPGDEMPDALEAHLRYPEDIFRIQTTAYGSYHITDPGNFFTQTDGWRVARDPGTAGAEPSTPVTDNSGQVTGAATAPRIAPYYQLLQLPDTDKGTLPSKPEMVLMRPFVPHSQDDRSQLLTAFMAARMDPGHYGQLVVYQMPSNNLPDGPGLVAASISADTEVSGQETLLGGAGSEVRLGNLLLVPIDNALLYVQPFYVAGTGDSRDLPRLERVVAVFGDQVVIKNNLADALKALFGQNATTLEEPGNKNTAIGGSGGTGSGATGGTATGTATQQAQTLLNQAATLFAQADADLKRDGDLGAYQAKIKQATDKVGQANRLLAQANSGTKSTTTTAPKGPEGA